ncbi:hypothetical protein KUTeg_005344 [Tegillarca granosa]|uniref:Coiled-coil SMC6 And NSE5 INteracting (CANIN) domain-containing protein n=1 Tax=Tegillarca granosa TaxID=220873 RepID=A0ABQ9FME1_TEGGR|nr:hypothetical protein KUTeg_005344 [Tegillarca granosa]
MDSLLAEKTEKFEEQKEYGQLKSKLKAEIKRGGFVVDTLEETDNTSDDGLLPEHEIKLQRFQVSESSIKDVHRGEEIFATQRYKQMFTETLRPQDCGFVPGSTYIDTYLATVLPGDYMSFLSSDLFGMCFGNVSCPDAVCRWIYYIMSIHSSHLVMNGCCNILEEHINTQKHYTSGPTWSPSAKDLLVVLLNCGATVELLLPGQFNIPGKEELIDSIQILNSGNQDGHHDNNERYNRENLRLAIRVLALCLQGRPKHTAKQLTCMLVMLCKAALDQSLNNYMLTYEIQVCLSNLLLGYSTEEWQSQAPYLCQILSGLTDHHHNMVYLVQLFKQGRRMEYIQKRISFLSLEKLFDVAPPDLNDIDNFKSDLQFLTDQLMKLTGDVRDNVASLDATRRTIFAYCPNKQQEVHIETVQSTQSDHDSDQSSEEDSQENQQDSGPPEDTNTGPSKQNDLNDAGTMSGQAAEDALYKTNNTVINKDKTENLMDVSVANIDSIDNNMDDSEMANNSEMADSVEDSEMPDELPDL